MPTSLFDPGAASALSGRVAKLSAETPRLWGKMTPAQALAHVSVALEYATGDRTGKQSLIGRILAPFVRKSLLGDKPFGRNGPTDPTLVVADARDLGTEAARLRALVERFVARGPAGATKGPHLFFGPLTGEEWGRLMYKHVDHHLSQFGV